MRRDYFTLEAAHDDPDEWGDDPDVPTVTVSFEGPAGELTDRLTEPSGDRLDADSVDVAYRLQDPVDGPDARGVVSVTNRHTGEFILELNADADDVLGFVKAARAYGKRTDGDARYRVRLVVDGQAWSTYEKSTLLVYDSDGSLLRQHSIIPSGVEL